VSELITPGLVTWIIGEVPIICVVEAEMAVPADELVPRAVGDDVARHLSWLQPNYVSEDGLLKLHVQSMLIESDGKRIIVDTCFGNDRQLPYPGFVPLHTDYLERIAAAGFDRNDVDVVLCTHLHFDHVGWNTMLVDGAWVPTFPHADYLFGRVEYDHWQQHEDYNIDLTDNVEPVVAAGLHRFVETDHRVTSEVELVPTPGHTPGHVSVRIRSNGEEALIGGDMIHHPVQVAEPDWAATPDGDPVWAAATRTEVLRGLADTPTLLIGTHFAAPSAGHIRTDGDAFSWEPC